MFELSLMAVLADSYANSGVLLFSLKWHRNRFLSPGCIKLLMADAQ